jgi:hypothetical protein
MTELEFEKGAIMTYFIPSRAYGYTDAISRIEVRAHCISATGKRIKCEFRTGTGRVVHRWIAPQSLSRARWDGFGVARWIEELGKKRED